MAQAITRLSQFDGQLRSLKLYHIQSGTLRVHPGPGYDMYDIIISVVRLGYIRPMKL